jgi:hypothetical protein
VRCCWSKHGTPTQWRDSAVEAHGWAHPSQYTYAEQSTHTACLSVNLTASVIVLSDIPSCSL